MPKKPEWTPNDDNPAFTTQVNEGVENPHSGRKKTKKKQKLQPASYYIEGIKKGNRTILAQTITILESNAEKHFELGQEILSELIKFSGKSIRIGITGAPGAGKSTFIDTFGSLLCKRGHKVAVLAVDPSSSISGGSILGDKTRMENLARLENAFIRPAPSGEALGGVARKTRESLIACEAAGYDIIIIETIGVGQSEITVRSMVDFFMLLLLPGEGDELQGLKKGTVELADAIIVNKADGNNIKAAEITKEQYRQAVHYISEATPGWKTLVTVASALKNSGIEDIWNSIKQFVDNTKKSGYFFIRRTNQQLDWFHSLLKDYLLEKFYNDDDIKTEIPKLEEAIKENSIAVSKAANSLIKQFLKK
jgi:LAO/AO transport system kinase